MRARRIGSGTVARGRHGVGLTAAVDGGGISPDVHKPVHDRQALGTSAGPCSTAIFEAVALLTELTLDELHVMKLHNIAQAVTEQLSYAERLGLLQHAALCGGSSARWVP